VSSERQIEANRQNAQRSTGPRTPEGKAKVAMNALKHGLTADRIVLANEDPEEFDAFRSAMLAALDPQDAVDEVLAERVVVNAWRLRRVPMLEAALLAGERQKLLIEKLKANVMSCMVAVRSESQRLLHEHMERDLTKYEVAPGKSEAYARAEVELAEARTQLKENLAIQVENVLREHATHFARLEQREGALDRAMVRMLNELQRRQATRAGKRVDPPAKLDVDVNLNNCDDSVEH
jgi:hypothetical protein